MRLRRKYRIVFSAYAKPVFPTQITFKNIEYRLEKQSPLFVRLINLILVIISATAFIILLYYLI